MTIDDLATLITTRQSLHVLAEHVLSPTLHHATGKIGLRASEGGFTTPPFDSPHGTRSIRVEGRELVDEDDRGVRRAALSTLRDASSFLEVEPGASASVYTPTTPLDIDATLIVDAVASHTLADWFALTDAALEILCTEFSDEDPAVVQLWPEHFDLATTIAEVNYGGSPGDRGHPMPYLYVGPWTPPTPDDGFWNQAFGASRSINDVSSVGDALAFFHEGRQRARSLR